MSLQSPSLKESLRVKNYGELIRYQAPKPDDVGVPTRLASATTKATHAAYCTYVMVVRYIDPEKGNHLQQAHMTQRP